MYTMHEVDEAFLKTLTRTPAHEELPAPVVAKYWEYLRVLNRTCAERPTMQTLALLVVLSGQTAATAADSPAPTIDKLLREGKVAVGDMVEVLYRKKWEPAKLLGANASGDVRVDMGGSERTVPTSTVRTVALVGV